MEAGVSVKPCPGGRCLMGAAVAPQFADIPANRWVRAISSSKSRMPIQQIYGMPSSGTCWSHAPRWARAASQPLRVGLRSASEHDPGLRPDRSRGRGASGGRRRSGRSLLSRPLPPTAGSPLPSRCPEPSRSGDAHLDLRDARVSRVFVMRLQSRGQLTPHRLRVGTRDDTPTVGHREDHQAPPRPDSAPDVGARSVGIARASGSLSSIRRCAPSVETPRVTGVPGPTWLITFATSSDTQI